jgi:Flp pilus assembly pilin Flp
MKRNFFSLRGTWSAKQRSTRRGQTLVEYSLIIGVVVIVAIGTLMTLGTQTKTLFSSINSQVARTSTGS